MKMYRYDIVNMQTPEVYLRTFNVVKKTPKGVWINEWGYWDKDRFVLLGTRKAYAYPTKELALESFFRRKESQLKIITRQLKLVNAALEGREKITEVLLKEEPNHVTLELPPLKSLFLKFESFSGG